MPTTCVTPADLRAGADRLDVLAEQLRPVLGRLVADRGPDRPADRSAAQTFDLLRGQAHDACDAVVALAAACRSAAALYSAVDTGAVPLAALVPAPR